MYKMLIYCGNHQKKMVITLLIDYQENHYLPFHPSFLILLIFLCIIIFSLFLLFLSLLSNPFPLSFLFYFHLFNIFFLLFFPLPFSTQYPYPPFSPLVYSFLPHFPFNLPPVFSSLPPPPVAKGTRASVLSIGVTLYCNIFSSVTVIVILHMITEIYTLLYLFISRIFHKS